MKKTLILLCLIILGYCAWQASLPRALRPQQVARLEAAHNVDQLILVGVSEGSKALCSFYQKEGGIWREIFTAQAYVGKNGLGKTREGDGKTPLGIFHFTKAFGIAPDPGCALPYTQVDATHYWVGDNASPLYNQFTSTTDGADFDLRESEHIIDYGQPYQYCLNISYNEDGKPGLGSAIFLHCYSHNTSTAGCVAIPEEKMRELLRMVRPGCRIVIAALDTLANF